MYENKCGDCKHWTELDKNKQEYKLKKGVCTKVPEGTLFSDNDKEYVFNSICFEDECYDDWFNCFDLKEDYSEN